FHEARLLQEFGDASAHTHIYTRTKHTHTHAYTHTHIHTHTHMHIHTYTHTHTHRHTHTHTHIHKRIGSSTFWPSPLLCVKGVEGMVRFCKLIFKENSADTGEWLYHRLL